MDRDNRWDRVEKGYNALLLGEGEHAASACEGVKASYERGDNDEFVLPTVIGGEESRIHDNDSIIFINFRPDRAREVSKALNFKDFDGFERKKVLKNLCYVTMTSYNEDFTFPVAFPKEHLVNILGDVLEANGVHQFRTAETENMLILHSSLMVELMSLNLTKQEFLFHLQKLQLMICNQK